MSPHPLSESFIKKSTGIAVTIFAAVVLWLLLTLYGDNNLLTSAVVGSIYVSLLAIAGYMYWFVIEYIQKFLVKAIVAITIQLACLASTFAILTILEIEDVHLIVRNFPLCLVFGILCHIILTQWYRLIISKSQLQQMDESVRKDDTCQEKFDIIDRISVKEGSQIHIIRLDELQYLQAYGDYVMLFTNKGKYIKEQTMRYFELHLPSTFVRIHRSCIVNSEKITRVELFGKESYNVHLNNGSSLKASTNGYKILKEKLLL
jgi:DNA-binding LytR/AlgR family response regulator